MLHQLGPWPQVLQLFHGSFRGVDFRHPFYLEHCTEVRVVENVMEADKLKEAISLFCTVVSC